MVANLMDLTGRVAVITGGGRGIGRETARVLAGAGANIAIAELDQANGEEVAAELRSAEGEHQPPQPAIRDGQHGRSPPLVDLHQHERDDNSDENEMRRFQGGSRGEARHEVYAKETAPIAPS